MLQPKISDPSDVSCYSKVLFVELLISIYFLIGYAEAYPDRNFYTTVSAALPVCILFGSFIWMRALMPSYVGMSLSSNDYILTDHIKRHMSFLLGIVALLITITLSMVTVAVYNHDHNIRVYAYLYPIPYLIIPSIMVRSIIKHST